MKRIGLLVCAVAGIVALGQVQAQAQAQGSSQPAQVESTNCDQCRQASANCQSQKTPYDKALCERAAQQCRCQGK